MKGKQSVEYRMCSDKFLEKFSELSYSVSRLLMKLLYMVDKKDNCVQIDFNKLVKEESWDRSNSHRYLTKLKQQDIVKYVNDISGVKRLMINPEFMWSTGRDKLRFAVNMYVLGSHAKAVDHKSAEKEACGYIDPRSGLLISEYQSRLDRLNQHYKDQAALSEFLNKRDSGESGMPYEFFCCIAKDSLDYLVDNLNYTKEYLG